MLSRCIGRMRILLYNFKDMRKLEYEIFTCVWSKTLSLDMHLVINPFLKDTPTRGPGRARSQKALKFQSESFWFEIDPKTLPRLGCFVREPLR